MEAKLARGFGTRFAATWLVHQLRLTYQVMVIAVGTSKVLAFETASLRSFPIFRGRVASSWSATP